MWLKKYVLEKNMFTDENFQKTIESKYTIIRNFLIEKWKMDSNIGLFDYFLNEIFNKIKSYPNNIEKVYEISIWSDYLDDFINFFQSNNVDEKDLLMQWIKDILKTIEEDFNYIFKDNNILLAEYREINIDIKDIIEKNNIIREKRKRIEAKNRQNETLIEDITNKVVFWNNENQKIETDMEKIGNEIFDLEKQKVNEFKNFFIFIFSFGKNNKNKVISNKIKTKQQEIVKLSKRKNENFQKISEENKRLEEFKAKEAKLKTQLLSNFKEENELLNIINDYNQKYLKIGIADNFKTIEENSILKKIMKESNKKTEHLIINNKHLVENHENKIFELHKKNADLESKLSNNKHLVENHENEIFELYEKIVDLESKLSINSDVDFDDVSLSSDGSIEILKDFNSVSINGDVDFDDVSLSSDGSIEILKDFNSVSINGDVDFDDVSLKENVVFNRKHIRLVGA